MPPLGKKSMKERVGALRNLRPFLVMVWRTSPQLTAASLVLRLVRALLPVATLYVGKLIIDDVVRLVQLPDRPQSLQEWLQSGQLSWLGLLLGIEFAFAVLADVLGRVVSLIDSLLSERVSNASSVRLMEHAAKLDLEDFEDADFQDQLERARRQTSGRMTLMGQLFSQAQDIVTVASFAAGLLIYAPWLIVLLLVALIPAFLGEAHFNAQSYSLNYARTPERRELDYVRQTAASAETAKEVKIFGLNGFLIERYRRLAAEAYAANRKLALRRAGWGGVFTAVGTIGYYLAYAYIVWRTLPGEFSIGDLTFLAGSFRRLRNLLEGLLSGFSTVAGQALYLNDLFSFFEVEPEINSPADPLPFPTPIREGFVFENVGFIYPGADRWAVRALSFTLKAGEVLALVGENGAGKTTLVKLLTRLYDPDEGRILLDGHDLRDYDLGGPARQYRRHLPGFRPLQPDRLRQYRRRPDRGTRRSRTHRAGSQAQPCRRGDSEAARWVRPDDRQALQERRRALRRRVAEDRHRARLHARSSCAHPRRAHGSARRPFRVRGVPALQGAERRQDGGTHLAPLLQRAHGRSHRGAPGWQGRSVGDARGARLPAGALFGAL